MPTKKKVRVHIYDGQMLFKDAIPGMEFILLQGERVVRDRLFSTAVEVFVKLWNPEVWTKQYKGKEPATTKYPTALNIRRGSPAHIKDEQEVQILY